jgi:tetratricopeptide (TPR) repeat protein
LDFPHKSLELARLLSYTKRYEASVLQYKKLLDQKPDLAEARLELARVLYWKGDLDEVEKVFSTVPEQQLSPAAKLEMADIHVARKKYEPAVEIYAGHLLSEPSDHAVRLNWPRCLAGQAIMRLRQRSSGPF